MNMDLTSMSLLRNTVIEKLKYHYAHGNLEEEEFERLLVEATNADDKATLVPIHNMLAPVPLDGDVRPENIPVVERKKYGQLTCILGGIERKGVWNVPRNLKIVSVLGGAELNMTMCDLGNEDTVIDVLCLLGGIEIIVPDNVEIIIEAVPILGGFEDSTESLPGSGPRIIIRGIAALGGMEIRPMNKRERKRLRK